MTRARLIGNAFQRDPGLVLGKRHAAGRSFDRLVRGQNQRAGDIIKTRSYKHSNPKLLGKLNRSGVHYARAETGQLQHFVVADRLQSLGLGQQSRICRKDAIDIGVDFAKISTQDRR